LGGCVWVGKFSIAILWFISFAPKLLYFDSRQTNVRIEIKRKAATGSSSSQWKTCEKHARLKEVDEGFAKGVGQSRFATVRSPNQKLRIPATTLDPTTTPARFHHQPSTHTHCLLAGLTFLHSRVFFLYISHSVKFSKCHFAVISWIIRLQLR